jgi:hypothetical protein
MLLPWKSNEFYGVGESVGSSMTVGVRVAVGSVVVRVAVMESELVIVTEAEGDVVNVAVWVGVSVTVGVMVAK